MYFNGKLFLACGATNILNRTEAVNSIPNALISLPPLI